MDYKKICTVFCTNPDNVGMGVDDGGISISFDKAGERWSFLNNNCAYELFELLKSYFKDLGLEKQKKLKKKNKEDRLQRYGVKRC